MTNSILEVKNLTTSFSTEEGELIAVDNISFRIEKGSMFGLVGESGSGKSVTALSVLRLLDSAGHIEADEILFNGRDLLELSDEEMRKVRGSEIGVIFQNPATSLNPVMTVGEQIAEVVRHHGSTGESSGFWNEMRRKFVSGTSTSSESWQRAIDLLGRVGIPAPADRAEDYPHQLSGGMKQRVMIAQALAGDPSLIIADEPTTALDVTIEAQILDELEEMQEEFGVSVLLITHDLGVIRETCDDVTVMYAGELMESGTVDEVIDNPQHPYTQDLIDCIPTLSDSREWLTVSEGNVPELSDRRSGCPYYDRCEHAFDACHEPLEAFEEPTTGNTVWCHLYDPETSKEAPTEQPKQEVIGMDTNEGGREEGTDE